MSKTHDYAVDLTWTGNKGTGTSSYRAYSRDYTVSVANKPDILGASDPAFLGDPSRHNPEDMFLASVASCHMLWYLHLASAVGIKVVSYKDSATGTMVLNTDGSGEFSSITLRPIVGIDDPQQTDKARALHDEVGALCFIARSIKVPIRHEITVVADG